MPRRILGSDGPEGIGDQLALWVHHYNWHRSHESLHGDTPIDRVCQLADKTPLWAAVGDAYDPPRERIQIRHHVVDIAGVEMMSVDGIYYTSRQDR